jgi:hypothetical protein
MTFKMQALCGAAALCLVAGATTAATAKTRHHITKASDSQAQQETRQLNEAQLQHPGQVQGASGMTAQNSTGAAQSNAAMAQNGAEQNARMGNSSTGNGPMGKEATSNMAKSAPMSSSSETAANVSKPKSTLASAKVEDSSGTTIGQVSDVQTNSSGQAQMIDVSLTNSGKKVQIDATKLHYEPTRHALQTNMSADELEQSNGVASQSDTQTP